MTILDQYVMATPSHQNAINLFEGEWSSHLPGNFESGNVPLFNDPRIEMISNHIGGFAGKKVLELGPLEGGHTFMMSRGGATHVTAIEANSRAYLKCLIAKEVLNVSNCSFVLGDFDETLEQPDAYDFLLACGVIYHCANPVKTIVNMCKRARSIGIWSRYYAEEPVRRVYGDRFSYTPNTKSFEGYSADCYEHNYQEALDIDGFCGGGNTSAFWMSRDTWTSLFDSLGFNFDVLSEATDHPHGPEMTAVATKR